VSDHSPCTPQLKLRETGDFMHAWGGIAGLQLGLSVLFTETSRRGIDLATMFQWNAVAPAALAGLGQRKGRLAQGFDADVVIWNDKQSFIVAASDIRHRHKATPYAGRTLSGVVEQTFVRGERAFSRTAGLPSRPVGSFLSASR
jgi:allantoinase